MAKLLKQMIVQELTQELQKYDSFILFDFNKMNALQTYQLRKALRAKNIKMKVLKNTLAEILSSNLYHTSLEQFLKGPTAIAYGGESAAEVAKTLLDLNKKGKWIRIKGGYIPKKVLTPKEIEELAKTPPREVIYAQLAGAFEHILQQPALLVAAPCQTMSYALSSYIDKKEKEGK